MRLLLGRTELAKSDKNGGPLVISLCGPLEKTTLNGTLLHKAPINRTVFNRALFNPLMEHTLLETTLTTPILHLHLSLNREGR